MWENRGFTLKLEENRLQDYERIMLTSGQCSLFMPMGFVRENDGETACYDCSGFAPLSSYRIERTEDVLYILERIMVILAQAVEYLIFPARIALTTDTVFYNKETGQVKIAYVPLGGNDLNLRTNILRLMAKLRKDIRDGKEVYVNRVAKDIYYHNYGIRDIINKIGLYKRELFTTEEKENKGKIQNYPTSVN